MMDQVSRSLSSTCTGFEKQLKYDGDGWESSSSVSSPEQQHQTVARVVSPPPVVILDYSEPSPSLVEQGRYFQKAPDASDNKEATADQKTFAAEIGNASLHLESDSTLDKHQPWSSCESIETSKKMRQEIFTVSTSSSASFSIENSDEWSTDDTFTESEAKKPTSFADEWERAIAKIHCLVKSVLFCLTHFAAVNPVTCIIMTVIFSFTILAVGFKTNFTMENDQNLLWKPNGSLAEQHGIWIDTEWKSRNEQDKLKNKARFLASDQKSQSRGKPSSDDDSDDPAAVSVYTVSVLIHNQGDNVVNIEGISRLFEAHELVLGTPRYNEYCAQNGDMSRCPSKEYEGLCALAGIPVGAGAPMTCPSYGATSYFLNDLRFFHATSHTDESVQEMMARDLFQGKTPRFQPKNIIGYPEYNQFNSSVVFGKSLTVIYRIPSERGDEGMALTRDIVNRLLELQWQWKLDSNNKFRLYVFSNLSFADEFKRGIVKDITLVPLAFIIMSLFTCLIFYKHNSIHSRCFLGLGAVASVVLSILTGYGLMFCIGVKFTSLTQLLPFIMFGIGLDDGFVLIASHSRRDTQKDPVQRVRDTIDDVGVSIFMTTLTTILAFCLGCTTTIPSIRWLCLYAAPTITIDFIYQITFFISIMVLDDRRIMANRKDCCLCLMAEPQQTEDKTIDSNSLPPKLTADRIMKWYSEKLLRPWTKAIVVTVFMALFGLSIYSTTKIGVRFDFMSVLPRNSFLIDYQEASDEYAQMPAISPYIYFRNVDQSDPEIRQKMRDYVDKLVLETPAITSQPFDFWLSDYEKWSSGNPNIASSHPFNQTLIDFLSMPEFKHHSGSLILDENSNIIASRTVITFDNMSLRDADEFMEAFAKQREVSEKEPLNQNGDWNFFTFDPIFYLWEFLFIIQDQLVLNTIQGIIAVSLVALLLIPHWSAALIVFPLTIMLYIDLVGFIQVFGIDIDGVSYVTLVMSIGLLVDFIMHIALRYFESKETTRQEKTKDVLQTMGTSVLLGGLSTFLGVLPLAFASTEIFYTVFIVFLGIVSIGLTHGLIFFPVVLSMLGPQ